MSPVVCGATECLCPQWAVSFSLQYGNHISKITNVAKEMEKQFSGYSG